MSKREFLTNFEFCMIMEYFRIKILDGYLCENSGIIKILKKQDLSNKYVYRILGGFEIEIENNKVKGKIPAEIIIKLYNKYADEGVFEYPIEVIMDQFLDDDILDVREKIRHLDITTDEKIVMLKEEFEKLRKRDNDSKFLECFLLSTKELLIDFVVEVINYNRKLRNIIEISEEEREIIKYEIETYVIKKSNPNIPIFVWLTKIDYAIDKEKENNKFKTSSIKEKLGELDNIINPFLNSLNYLDNIKNYYSKLETNVRVDVKDTSRFNNLTLSIKEKNIDNGVEFTRNEKGVSFLVHGYTESGYMYLKHSYMDDEEKIIYERTGDSYFYLEYKVSDNLIFKAKTPVSYKRKKIFVFPKNKYLELLDNILDEVIDYGRTITINNMSDVYDMEKNKKLTI